MAESLSRAIVTAPDGMFLYLIIASIIVSPAIIPPSSLLYADCSSLVPVIQFAPVAHSFLLELSFGDRITADVPAGPIAVSLLKDPSLTTDAVPSFIPLAILLHFSSCLAVKGSYFWSMFATFSTVWVVQFS